MTRILTVLTLLLLAGTLVACPPRARVIVAAKEVVVVKEVVPIIAPIAVLAPITVAVPVPSYSAVYVPPPAVSAPAPTQAPGVPGAAQPPLQPALPPGNNELETLRRENAELRKRLAPAEPQSDPATPKPEAKNGLPASAKELLKAKCFSCHSGEKSKGNFKMFGDDGNLLLTLHKGKVYRITHDGVMPQGSDGKPKPLSDSEIDLLRTWLAE